MTTNVKYKINIADQHSSRKICISDLIMDFTSWSFIVL